MINLSNTINSQIGINVSFKENLTRNELLCEIAQVNQPQVVFWYIGEYGFREQGVNYYKKELRNILKLPNQSTCLLYDLTAWAAFRNSEKRINTFNQNVDVINAFAIERIRCMKSSDFFYWLKNEDNPNVISYMKDVVLKREFIFKASESYPETSIKVGQLFERTCPMLENIYDKDCGKSYSAFQYIEGCYLVNRILQESASEVNMIFALPNDEAKYYRDSGGSFAQDVATLVKEKRGEVSQDKRVNIMFYTFRFGTNIGNRPYNAGPKNIEMISKSQFI